MSRRGRPAEAAPVNPAAAVLQTLSALVAKGLPGARCRNAVEEEVARWRRDLGEAAAAGLAAELHAALAEGVDAAEQGAADYDGDDRAMRTLLAAQLAAMVAARDAAARAAG